MRDLGIYVHIPFCKRKCYYCDFVSYDDKIGKIDKYVQTLITEIENYKNNNKLINIETNIDYSDCIVNTIYIGGGTPSFIESKYIKLILEVLRKNFNVSSDAEITIEVNPGTVNEEKLKTYQMCSINRLSIGLQSTSDEMLKQIGRIHTYSEFLSTYNLARKIGYNNINVDLIFGLPNQTIEMLEKDIDSIIELNPEHISTYSLIVEENTKLKEMLENNQGHKDKNERKLVLPDEDVERKMYWLIKERLEKKGYIHYEISNFAKKDYYSRHNTDCWKQKEYLGFGVNAHSYIDKKRYSNKKILSEYMFNCNEKNIEEMQNREAEAKEYMMLGLRMIDGVKISEFERKFDLNPLMYFRFEISKLVEENLLEIDLDNIKLTKKGLDLANIVFEEFI